MPTETTIILAVVGMLGLLVQQQYGNALIVSPFVTTTNEHSSIHQPQSIS